ncbi:MAG: hypothetical protein K6T90_15150 [Leptolyngbyaceae cyanobacterium HOT.MB2.61]|nr:hypothetical protein [Leptolyngbyaceae cyanobacterium HOT.MB2.61]
MIKLVATLIKDFDNKNTHAQQASPLDVFLDLMESNGMKQADLAGKIGSSGVVSEIVNSLIQKGTQNFLELEAAL